MNVICINKGKIKNLTEGRGYQVVKTNSGFHFGSDIPYSNMWIINDAGIEKHYSSKRFLTISEFRNIKIDSILK
jgi:hypothetical protein